MGKSYPAWMNKVFNVVRSAITWRKLVPHRPIGYRSLFQNKTATVVIFPNILEIVGGKNDGQRITPDYTLDIRLILDAFNTCSEVYWDTDEKAVTFCGTIRNIEVTLSVCALPPDEDVEIHLVDYFTGKIKND